MNNYSICLLIGSILILIILGLIFYKVGFTFTKALILLAIAILLGGLIYLSVITDFFTSWDELEVLRIVVEKDEIIF